MNPTFRSRLAAGELLTGTLITLPSPEVAEIFANAGFDWLFVDLEHTPLDAKLAQDILQAVGERPACLLRVPLNDEIWIKKALDIGAAGVIVPQVNSAREAERAVRFSKYPPQGSRSVGIARAQGYGMGLQAYLQAANEYTAVVVQVEHIQAVENLEEILAVAGVDGVLVGPYDLSASLGVIGQVDHPAVQTALAKVKAACQKHSKPLGIFAASMERARDYLQEGYSLIAVGTDTLMLGQAASTIVQGMRTKSS